MSAEPSTFVVFFDGTCNLCNGTVQFILARDTQERFRFAPLQSAAARQVLAGRDPEEDRKAADSVILLEGDRVYERSDAALRIARRLDGLWPVLYVFIVVPRFVRDAVYDLIARNRYRWFGRAEQCLVPSPELRDRFLDP